MAKKGVLLIPSGVQFLGPPKPPRIRSPRSAKCRCNLALYWRVFWEGFSSPIFNGQAAFQFVVSAVGAVALFVLVGRKMLTDTANTTAAAIAAFAVAMVVWALIQAVATPFRAKTVERQQGRWIGNRFIYNEPKHVFTTEWTPAKNGQHETFEVPDAAPFAVVDYRIEIDGPADHLRCMVVGSYYFSPLKDILTLWEPALHGRVMLKKRRKLDLHCYAHPQTLPAIIRVYILAWEIDRDFLMDYTDQRTATRFELKPPWAQATDAET